MEPIREGWLIKSPPERRLRRHWKLFKGKWRRRYFVLYAPPAAETFPASCSAILDYYNDSNQKRKRGTIDLSLCEEVISRLDSALHRHVFGLRTVDGGRPRTYYLAADSGKEMDEWVSAMCRVLGMRESSVDESGFCGSNSSTPVAPAPPPRSSLPVFPLFGIRSSDRSSSGSSTPTVSTLPHPRRREGAINNFLSQLSNEKRYQNGSPASSNVEYRTVNSEPGPNRADLGTSGGQNGRPRYSQISTVPRPDGQSRARASQADGYLPPKQSQASKQPQPPSTRPVYNNDLNWSAQNGYNTLPSRDAQTVFRYDNIDQMSPLNFVPPPPVQSQSSSHCMAPPINQCKPTKSSSMGNLLNDLDNYDSPRLKYGENEMKLPDSRTSHATNRMNGTGSSSNLLDDFNNVNNQLYNVPRVNYVAESVNINQKIIEYLYKLPNQQQSPFSGTYDRPSSSDQSRDSASLSTNSDYDMPPASSNRISPSDAEVRQMCGDYDMPCMPGGNDLYSRPRNMENDSYKSQSNDNYRANQPLTLNGLRISGNNPFAREIISNNKTLERDSNGNQNYFLESRQGTGFNNVSHENNGASTVHMRKYSNAELLAMSPPVPCNEPVQMHSYINAATQLVERVPAPSAKQTNAPMTAQRNNYCNQFNDGNGEYLIQSTNGREKNNIEKSSKEDYSSFQSPGESHEVIELPIKFTKRSKSFKRTVPNRQAARDKIAATTSAKQRRTSLDSDNSSDSDSDSESSGGNLVPANGSKSSSDRTKPGIRISVYDVVPSPANPSTPQQREPSPLPSPLRSPHNLPSPSHNQSGLTYLHLELGEGSDTVWSHSGATTPSSPRNSINVEAGEQRKASVGAEVTDYKEIDWCRTKALNEMRNVVEKERRESCDS